MKIAPHKNFPLYGITSLSTLVCFQDGQVREAAKACASFGYRNPRNMHIKANEKFYSGQPMVTEEDQTPLEPKLYVSL
jgi:hypothetical protein